MFSELRDELSARSITLVVVSKTQPAERILSLYEQGQRDFGENRPQEMLEKYTSLPGDMHWHFIGHLQTNKVRLIAPFVHLIHSIDSLKLLQEVNKQAAQAGRVQDCLLQFHIAREETKFGFDEPVAQAMLASLAGLLLSYHYDTPSGPTIIGCAGALYGVSLLVAPGGWLPRVRGTRHRVA